MYEESISLLDIAIVAIIICGAAYYLYNKLFKKKGSGCGTGCSGCPSAQNYQQKKEK